jgi:hypothetical protein
MDKTSEGQETSTPEIYLVFPDDERGNEPSKAYRLNLPRYEDATYMNLGAMYNSPATE